MTQRSGRSYVQQLLALYARSRAFLRARAEPIASSPGSSTAGASRSSARPRRVRPRRRAPDLPSRNRLAARPDRNPALLPARDRRTRQPPLRARLPRLHPAQARRRRPADSSATSTINYRELTAIEYRDRSHISISRGSAGGPMLPTAHMAVLHRASLMVATSRYPASTSRSIAPGPNIGSNCLASSASPRFPSAATSRTCPTAGVPIASSAFVAARRPAGSGDVNSAI